MNAPHPHTETDWWAVAMFLASFITEEKPGYTLLIFQVIADCTKTVAQNTTHGAAGAGKEMAAP